MAMRTTGEALAVANTVTVGYGGLCLAFVQHCYAASARYGSAIAAWNASQHKHYCSSTSSIPVGAPIYFSPHGSPYGHIAVYAGSGRMRTTNSATGRVSTNSVASWEAVGYRLLGWTSDIEGQIIPNLEKSSPMTLSNKDIKAIAHAVVYYGINDVPGTKHETLRTKVAWAHRNTDLIRSTLKTLTPAAIAKAVWEYGINDVKGTLHEKAKTKLAWGHHNTDLLRDQDTALTKRLDTIEAKLDKLTK